jgi:hypothetical protein
MEVNELANLYREKFPAGTRITDNRIATFLTPVYERFRRQAPNAAAAGRRLWETVDRAIPRTYNKDAVKRIMNTQRFYAARQIRRNRQANNVNNVEDANNDNDNNSFEEEDDSDIEDDNSNAEDVSVVEDGNGEQDDSVAEDDSIADDSEDTNGKGDRHSAAEDDSIADNSEDDSIADNSEDANGEGDRHSFADVANEEEENNSNTEDVSVVEDGHGDNSEDANGADDSFNSDVAVVFSSVQLMEDIQAHEWNLRDEVDLQPFPGWIGDTPLQQDLMDPGDIYGSVNPYNIGLSVDHFTK